MTSKIILTGLVALAFIAGSIMTSNIVYASNHENGTPFLQAELDAITDIVDGMQNELNNLHVSWANVTDVPAGFADDIDNDLLAGLNCSTDQIIKSNGILWECTDVEDSSASGSGSPGLDCNTIKFMLGWPQQKDTRDGCDLRGAPIDIMDISGADLTRADFSLASSPSPYKSPAWFDLATATNVDFTDANIYGVDFYGTDLSGSNFSGAQLSHAWFQFSTLTDVNFSGTNVTGTSFSQSINQPTGSIDCIGIPIDADFTCTG